MRPSKLASTAASSTPGTVADEVEELPGRLCLGGAEQVRHSGDDERDAGRLKRRGDRLGVCLHAAEQDRHVGPRQTALDFVLRERDAAERLRRRGDVPCLFVRVANDSATMSPRLVGLRARRLHRLRETRGVLLDEGAGRLDDAVARAEVLLQGDLLDGRVALVEREDVLDVAAAPLVDRLVVVADHADPRAQLVKRPDDRLLHRVHVLVLVDDRRT